MITLRPYQQQALDSLLEAMPKPLLPNPRAYRVAVGQTVTCIYSQRPVVVAKIVSHGNIYEELPGGRFNFIGSYYEEFEPAFVSDDRLQTQLAQATCQ